MWTSATDRGVDPDTILNLLAGFIRNAREDPLENADPCILTRTGEPVGFDVTLKGVGEFGGTARARFHRFEPTPEHRLGPSPVPFTGTGQVRTGGILRISDEFRRREKPSFVR
jgi:hypothetical protein